MYIYYIYMVSESLVQTTHGSIFTTNLPWNELAKAAEYPSYLFGFCYLQQHVSFSWQSGWCWQEVGSCPWSRAWLQKRIQLSRRYKQEHHYKTCETCHTSMRRAILLWYVAYFYETRDTSIQRAEKAYHYGGRKRRLEHKQPGFKC